MEPFDYEDALLGNVMHFVEVMGCWANFRNGVDLQYFGKQLVQLAFRHSCLQSVKSVVLWKKTVT